MARGDSPRDIVKYGRLTPGPFVPFTIFILNYGKEREHLTYCGVTFSVYWKTHDLQGRLLVHALYGTNGNAINNTDHALMFN